MMTTKDLQEKLNIVINKAKADLPVATIAATVTTISTALGGDTTTGTIQLYQPPAALNPNLGR